MSPCKNVYSSEVTLRAKESLCKSVYSCKRVAVQKWPYVQKYPLVQKWPFVQKSRSAKKSPRAKVSTRAKESPRKSVSLCKSDARAKVTRSRIKYICTEATVCGYCRKIDTPKSFTAKRLRHFRLIVRFYSALVWSVLVSIHYGHNQHDLNNVNDGICTSVQCT